MRIYDVQAFPRSSGRWHWRLMKVAGGSGRAQILKPVPGEECCTQPGDENICRGFGDKKRAEENGWKRVRELENR